MRSRPPARAPAKRDEAKRRASTASSTMRASSRRPGKAISCRAPTKRAGVPDFICRPSWVPPNPHSADRGRHSWVSYEENFGSWPSRLCPSCELARAQRVSRDRRVGTTAGDALGTLAGSGRARERVRGAAVRAEAELPVVRADEPPVALGSRRAHLLEVLRRRPGAGIATHDPDGHAILLCHAPHKRGPVGNSSAKE